MPSGLLLSTRGPNNKHPTTHMTCSLCQWEPQGRNMNGADKQGQPWSEFCGQCQRWAEPHSLGWVISTSCGGRAVSGRKHKSSQEEGLGCCLKPQSTEANDQALLKQEPSSGITAHIHKSSFPTLTMTPSARHLDSTSELFLLLELW